MRKNIYKKSLINNKFVKPIILFYIVITIIFILIYITLNMDKNYYRKYKGYEMKFISEEQIIEKDILETINKYENNEINKRTVRKVFKQSSYRLEELCDKFKWTKGDKNTKELYIIRREIFLLKSQSYEKISKQFPETYQDIKTELQDYIDILIGRYNELDEVEMEKFKVNQN